MGLWSDADPDNGGLLAYDNLDFYSNSIQVSVINTCITNFILVKGEVRDMNLILITLLIQCKVRLWTSFTKEPHPSRLQVIDMGYPTVATTT